MKRLLIGLLSGMVMLGGSLLAEELPQAEKEVPRLTGADVLVDLAQHAGKQVVIIDGRVWGADNHGAYLEAGGATFRVRTEGIDRETFRYILKNCHEIVENPGCKVHLLAMPTGETTFSGPELTGVKIVR